MHIGLVCPAWPYGSSANGIVTYAHFLRHGLAGHGHRVTVFSGEVDPSATGPDICLVPTPGKLQSAIRRVVSRPLSEFDGAARISAAIRRKHRADPIDVVEMEETYGWAGEVAERIDVPLIVRLHGPAFLSLTADEKNTPFGQKRMAAEGASLKRLRAITAPSSWTLDETIRRYQLKPLVSSVIPNPVDTTADIPGWDPTGVDPDLILFVGRFDKIKGADIALSAFQKIAKRRPRVKLAFVGPDRGVPKSDGTSQSFRQYIESLNDSSMSSRVEYFGQQDPTTIMAMRPKAAVVIVPSRQENQPYAALEAMLQGCPLVCTDSSGLAELVCHEVTGMKARPEDPDDFALQIERVLDSRSLGATLGANARKQILSRHSPSRVAEETLRVYRMAVGRSATAAVDTA